MNCVRPFAFYIPLRFPGATQSFDRSTKKATGCICPVAFFGGPAQN